MNIEIKEPFWKYKALGVNEGAFKGKDYVDVWCSYKDKKGNYVYPHLYRVSKDLAREYRLFQRKSASLRIVPVADMEVIQENYKEQVENWTTTNDSTTVTITWSNVGGESK